MDAQEASKKVFDLVEKFRRDNRPFTFHTGERHVISKTERDIGIVIVCMIGHKKGTEFLFQTNNKNYRAFLKEFCNMEQDETYTIPYHNKEVNAERITQIANYFSIYLQKYFINWLELGKWILESGPSAKTFFEEKMEGFADP